MLIEFKVANFRSFRKCQTFSMVAETFSEHAETNTFDPGLTSGFGRLLRSAVVYGPNAGGKTNFLRALQAMQRFVIESAGSPRGTAPPHTPFRFSASSRQEPSEFQVTFVQNRIRYEYGFAIDSRRVRKEWLVEYVNPRGRTIFERTFDSKHEEYDWKFSPFLRGQRALWSESTRDESLFLSTAVQLNSKQLLPAFEWFQKRLVVIAGATSLNSSLTLQILRESEGKQRILPFLREADLGITDLTISREIITPESVILQNAPIIDHVPGEPRPSLVKVTFAHQTEEADASVGLDFSDESSGTQLLFRRAGAWLNVFANGEVLLIDEIDASLHPVLTRFLVKKFHNTSTNPHNAQLLFSTHNTSLLDQELFRRDQIWFVEKGDDGASKLYPLTDFKPRNNEALERGYLHGRYGALPILDETHP
jgi:AAA15 family ATPase/GTPase